MSMSFPCPFHVLRVVSAAFRPHPPLLPGPEVQRKGLTVIELTELEEDTATTLNAEDFE